MTELLPIEQAFNLRFSLLEFLQTTFNLFEQDMTNALTEFLSDPSGGVFRGPYVRLRLPFAAAASGWEKHLEVAPQFPPYGHQAAAFERLSTLTNSRPQPTILTTGTGSGKTEAFLLPILDHALRARRRGEGGTKALILYPMNALANDQARRLAALIARDYPGVTAALYTGEASENAQSKLTGTSLITDRQVIRTEAPDILLTNYKMLDQLLLRSEDAALWQQSAESLQYLVMDEFHTYDGAQGTDVAMLLRRLSTTLKAYWPADADPADQSRPLGKLTLVGTSATLGDEADPSEILGFAQTIVGEEIPPEAVITETRLTVEQWAAAGPLDEERFTALEPVKPNRVLIADLLANITDEFVTGEDPQWISIATDPLRAAQMFFEALFEKDQAPPDLLDAGPADLLNLACRHPFILELLRAAQASVALTDLVESFFPDQRQRTRLTRGPAAFLMLAISVLSHLRAECGRSAASVDVHLWIRDLTRVDRLAGSESPAFRWSDDGGADSETAFPALYCRHCGRSGWGVVLAPTGAGLDHDDAAIRRERLLRNDRFRPLIHVPVLNDADIRAGASGLCWFNTSDRTVSVATPSEAEIEDGTAIRVLTHLGEDAGERSLADVCPSCEADDGIRFLGSAIATQLSVALGALFGSEHLGEAEKKALVFTDSVQDAAHRAGFVGSRSHVLTLRSLMRDYIDTDPITLVRLGDTLLRDAGADPRRRYRILPPDIASREAFAPYWQDPSRLDPRLRERVLRRLSFDLALEFGLRTTVGRTLEATTSVAVGVTMPDSELITAARAALEKVGIDQLDGGPDDPTLVRWVRAIMMHLRQRGAIDHPWLTKYRQEEGKRWFLTGGRRRDEGMPAFGPHASAPTFPYLGKISHKDSGFEPISSERGWYAGWTAKCLGHGRDEAAAIATALFRELAARDLLGTVNTTGGATTYHLDPTSIRLHAASADEAANGRLAAACNACGSVTRGISSFIDALVGGPCLVHQCAGTLTALAQRNNYYRRMYAARNPKRVVAREHTSLLPAAERLEYETQFKQAQDNPSAPNVLVATPTLEMGIDIGDLSTVMLSSLPRTVASYLQRVGRAGRLSGNSLTVAFVTARGTQLPLFHHPLRVINGQVKPPATYLDAEEILRRQYLAFAADSLARAGVPSPSGAREAFRSDSDDAYLRRLIAEGERPDLVEEFIAVFPQVRPKTLDRLREWARAAEPNSSALAQRCLEASGAHAIEVEELGRRLREINETIGDLEQRASLPAASNEDKEAFHTARGARFQTSNLLGELTGGYWIGALEAAGLLPNYTLFDDSVTLDVSLSWVDPETEEFQDEAFSLSRASAQALRDFAPGATFYSRGYAIDVDAVDLSRTRGAVHTWSCCPACGFVHEHHEGDVPATCPRCGNTGIADAAQRIATVPLTHVSSVMRRAEAIIDDRTEDRRQRFYDILTLADIDPATSTNWFVENSGFGVRYSPDLTLRWLNLGPQNRRGATFTASGRDVEAGRFHVCRSCGKVNNEPGTNTTRDHRPWCPNRTQLDDDSIPVALSRTLGTEGVVIRLPAGLTIGETKTVPSLKAALLLALTARLGGTPDHLAVEVIKDPSAYGNNPEALLIYDTVPGGTGYLAEFTTPENMRELLARVADILRQCPCQEADPVRQACEECLLPYAAPREMESLSRAHALRSIEELLKGRTSGAEAEDHREASEWEVTVEEPAPPSRESHLEQLFRQHLRDRIEGLGARITERPGTIANDLLITMSAGNRWEIQAQPHLGFTRPDFTVRPARPDLPPVHIYTDGWAYHASAANPRVSDDAEKRAGLRAAEDQVMAITMVDLDGAPVAAPWFTDLTRTTLLESGQVSPGVVDLVSLPSFDQLIHWLTQPDTESLEKLGNLVPLAILQAVIMDPTLGAADGELRAAVDVVALAQYALERTAEEAMATAADFARPGGEPAWAAGVYRRGSVALAIQALEPDGSRVQVALVLDDSKLGEEHADSWREWLHLSNLLGWRSDPTVITTSSLVPAQAPAPVEAPVESRLELNAQWQELLADAIDEERSFLEELLGKHPDLPLPELGLETGESNEPLDIAWPNAKVAVVIDGDLASELERNGWNAYVLGNHGDINSIYTVIASTEA